MLTGNDLGTKEAGRFSFREPVASDAPSVLTLVKRSNSLALNSGQCYLMLCEHFASTSVVAETDGELIGFIIAYIPPGRRDTLYIWQIAVASHLRRLGLTKKMLRHILARHNLKSIRYIEASVNRSQDPSFRLFQTLAKEGHCKMDQLPALSATLEGSDSSGEEQLIRVGPLDPVSKTLIGRRKRAYAI